MLLQGAYRSFGDGEGVRECPRVTLLSVCLQKETDNPDVSQNNLSSL